MLTVELELRVDVLLFLSGIGRCINVRHFWIFSLWSITIPGVSQDAENKRLGYREYYVRSKEVCWVQKYGYLEELGVGEVMG